MADTSRIEELRRRVQRDPASIAFAQLAEEYRRAGRYHEAIETCEGGLTHHPGYLSARVTLGRSYLETNELDAAQLELKQVLRAAPENLAALRGLAEIHHRRGELQEALAHYKTALEFARNDPELQHLVEQIAKELEPKVAAPVVVDGLSFEEVKDAFLSLEAADASDGAVGVETPIVSDAEAPDAAAHETAAAPQPADGATASPLDAPTPADALPADDDPFAWPLAASELPVVEFVEEGGLTFAPAVPDESPVAPLEPAVVIETVSAEAAAPSVPADAPGDGATSGHVEALERWLDTIIAERQRRA